MANELKESKSEGEVLVRRGCPTTVSPVLERVKQNNLKPSEIVQCDSGFGDDCELRLAEAQSNVSEELERERIKTLEETTRNLRIDSPKDTEAAANRQPSLDSNNSERTEVVPVGGHFLNYATSNDPRYLLAPLREKLFGQDDDGDT